MGSVMEGAVFLFEIPRASSPTRTAARLDHRQPGDPGPRDRDRRTLDRARRRDRRMGLWGFGYTFMSGAFQAWITDEVGVERSAASSCAARASASSAASSVSACSSPRHAIAARRGRRRRRLDRPLRRRLRRHDARDRFPPAPTLRARPRSARAQTTAGSGLRYVRYLPLLLLILAISFFSGMSTEALDRLWKAHFIRDIGLPSSSRSIRSARSCSSRCRCSRSALSAPAS